MVAILRANSSDAPAILALQKLAYQSEARIYNDWSLPPLQQLLESLVSEFTSSVVLKAVLDDRVVVGSVRGSIRDGTCFIGRLIVHPDFQRRGIGSELMARIESEFPQAPTYQLFTGSESEGNIRLYQRLSYRVTRTEVLSPSLSLVFMEKTRG
jgi:ribosomal protein S18 acetylase RimI-like enzyme